MALGCLVGSHRAFQVGNIESASTSEGRGLFLRRILDQRPVPVALGLELGIGNSCSCLKPFLFDLEQREHSRQSSNTGH